jgi:methyl-accepting chemotaxis protein
VVAGEFKKLTEDSQRATDEIAQIVGEVSDSAAAMVQRSEEGVRQSEQAVGQAEHEIREALGRIDGLMQSTRERIEELGSHAESLARDIREIVVSIQFQDITRQRIEHVIDPLQELSEEFSSLGDTVLSFEHLEDLLSQSAQSYAERLEDRYTMEAEKEVMRQTMEQSAAREGTE